MIEGVVNAAHEAVLGLALQGPAGQTRDIEAVIDTGFTGFLTVTPALAAKLGLPFEGIGRATLADGSEATFPYSASPCSGMAGRDTWRRTPLTPRRSSACGSLTATACTWKSRTVGASSSKLGDDSPTASPPLTMVTTRAPTGATATGSGP